ncbi:MAG: hypothetical protein HQ564_02745 [Candidatus Saganbacteria bacterium]|nr:hypothetical protein [Candidatus Saganbacteria bacterium]
MANVRFNKILASNLSARLFLEGVRDKTFKKAKQTKTFSNVSERVLDPVMIKLPFHLVQLAADLKAEANKVTVTSYLIGDWIPELIKPAAEELFPLLSKTPTNQGYLGRTKLLQNTQNGLWANDYNELGDLLSKSSEELEQDLDPADIKDLSSALTTLVTQIKTSIEEQHIGDWIPEDKKALVLKHFNLISQIHLDYLPGSVRLINSFVIEHGHGQINKLRIIDFVSLNKKQLLTMKNFGKATLRELSRLIVEIAEELEQALPSGNIEKIKNTYGIGMVNSWIPEEKRALIEKHYKILRLVPFFEAVPSTVAICNAFYDGLNPENRDRVDFEGGPRFESMDQFLKAMDEMGLGVILGLSQQQMLKLKGIGPKRIIEFADNIVEIAQTIDKADEAKLNKIRYESDPARQREMILTLLFPELHKEFDWGI